MTGIETVLLPVNCFHNFKIEPDGTCRSKTCMLNQNEEIAKDIQKNGCRIFDKDPEVLEMRKGSKRGE